MRPRHEASENEVASRFWRHPQMPSMRPRHEASENKPHDAGEIIDLTPLQ